MSRANRELLLSTNDLKVDCSDVKMLYCIQLLLDGLKTTKERVRLRQFKESANLLTLMSDGKAIDSNLLMRQADILGLRGAQSQMSFGSKAGSSSNVAKLEKMDLEEIGNWQG